ncbi:MAG: VCBS repeat-containing protein, partial [Gammaproteobacteria bacterium]|nr:VCBS repeat-containing protein [Gammaproteobacteria bacterium]
MSADTPLSGTTAANFQNVIPVNIKRLPLLLLVIICSIASSVGWTEERAVQPTFVDVTGSSGIGFLHDSGPTDEYLLPEVMGSGVAVFDYDQDDDLDIYFVGGLPGTGRLYRRDDSGIFEDVTEQANLHNPGHGMGTALGDIDNDGDLDLYLTNLEGDRLQRNNGDGTFTDVTAIAGIEADTWSSSATFCDIDGDGFLDLFVATYVMPDKHQVCSTETGGADYCPPNVYPSQPDRLYRNEGDGTFVDISTTSGIGRVINPALGVVCSDFNRDGRVDIFVANDGAANFLWINQGDGTFVERGMLWGVATNLFGESQAGMGIALGDVNGDAALDIFLTHVDQESNTLYTSTRDGAMMDGTIRSKLGPVSVPYTGFGTAFLDMDHDGDLDLAVANGRVRKPVETSRAGPSNTQKSTGESFTWLYGESNLLLENSGQGKFHNVCAASFSCAEKSVSRGLIAADLDRDGDLDLLLSNSNGPARIFENRVPKQGRWLQLRLSDPRIGRDAIGAVVRARVGERWLVRPVIHT